MTYMVKMYNRMVQFTDRLFTKHLLLTNTGLGIFFLGTGDVIQQNIEKRLYNKSYELKRTGNLMVTGCAFGVLGHYWYRFLDSRFPTTSFKHVSRKILAEMALGPPLCLGFFMAVGYLEGKAPQKSFYEFKKNFFLILAADWAVYAPLQGVNFVFVPKKYRFLYVCALCLAYDIFLSYILYKEDNEIRGSEH